MKKIIAFLSKLIVAGFISLAILSLMVLPYYNPPIADEQPEFITNNRFIPVKNWFYAQEGLGYGRTDSMGYNNAYYDDCSDPDVVVVGSSHMEAWQVPQDANCVYLLNDKFATDSIADNDFKCLNIGISAHFFDTTASNYEFIADRFKNAKYIVIEISDAKFSEEVLDGMLKGEYHTPMKRRGAFGRIAQRLPLLRLMHRKYQEANAVGGGENDTANDGSSSSDETIDMKAYTEKMDLVLGKIKKISDKSDITPIVMIHERFSVECDGSITMEKEEIFTNEFKRLCERNGIIVVDPVPEMIAEYRRSYKYSYGFANSVPGTGHLNKLGHRIVADELYKCINEMEVR